MIYFIILYNIIYLINIIFIIYKKGFNMKNIIRINENDLQRMVENSVRRALKEGAVNEYGLKDFGRDAAFAGGIGAAGAAGLAGNALYNYDEPEIDPQQQEINASVADEFGSPQGRIPSQNELPSNTISWEKANQFEGKLNRAITESITNFINELSSDTRDEARAKAQKKYIANNSKYGPNAPRTQQARSQFNKFADSVDSEYYKGNTAKKARMDKNKEDRKTGKRTYVSGKGWRTKQDEA
jgi:hypothetical protein